MCVFTGQLIAIFTLLALALFQTPLRHDILRDVMGLTPELAAYCEPALAAAFVMAVFWSCTALFRGFLARSPDNAIAGGKRYPADCFCGHGRFTQPGLPGDQWRIARDRCMDTVLCRRNGDQQLAIECARLVRRREGMMIIQSAGLSRPYLPRYKTARETSKDD